MLKKVIYLILVFFALVVPMVVVANPADVTDANRTITPNPVAAGSQATVSLSMSGNACQVATGADVALVVDKSGSMYLGCNGSGCPNPPEDRIGPAVNAANNFIQRMDFSKDQGGVVAFAGPADQNIASLGSSSADLTALLNTLPGLAPAGTGTAIGSAVTRAQSQLANSSKPNNIKAMIVLSDGENNAGVDPLQAAQNACASGTQIYTIGLGSDVDPQLPQMPCNGGFYTTATSPAELDAIYQRIADTVLGPIGFNATVVDVVPAGVSVVPNSISNGGTLSGNTITWSLTSVLNNANLTYRVTAGDGGYVFDAGSVTYTNCASGSETVQFPSQTLSVSGQPTAIPEPMTMALFGGGVAALGAYVKRRRDQKANEDTQC